MKLSDGLYILYAVSQADQISLPLGPGNEEILA